MLGKHLHPPIALSIEQVDKAIRKIVNNTASGHDNICIEHFKRAHSSVTFILTFILNIFIGFGEVSLDFGQGIVSPIPKFKGYKKCESR